MTATNDFRRWWDGLDKIDANLVKFWAKCRGEALWQLAGESNATQYAEELYRENPGNQSLDDALPDLMEKVREMVLEVVK